MKKILGILCLVLAACIQTSQAATPAPVKGYIVVFKDSVGSVPDVANEMAKQHAFKVDRTYGVALKGFTAKMPAAVLDKVKADARVQYVEEDVEASALGISETFITNSLLAIDCSTQPLQKIDYGVKRVGGGITTSNHIAWIIDTGIDLVSCDLNIDLMRSKNFVPLETSPQDKNGHGTHVAGIIAAKNNGIGTVGVTPDTRVVAVRVLGATGTGASSTILAGVDYVAKSGTAGDVVNMSLGFAGHLQSYHDAINKTANLGIFFAISAGNSAANTAGYEPAHVENSRVFTVSAISSTDTFASFSNWGNPPVDFAAPGMSILSTKMGGGTMYMSGTSMAAPHVAGLLLLGVVHTDKYAIGDPDGNPDPIAHN